MISRWGIISCKINRNCTKIGVICLSSCALATQESSRPVFLALQQTSGIWPSKNLDISRLMGTTSVLMVLLYTKFTVSPLSATWIARSIHLLSLMCKPKQTNLKTPKIQKAHGFFFLFHRTLCCYFSMGILTDLGVTLRLQLFYLFMNHYVTCYTVIHSLPYFSKNEFCFKSTFTNNFHQTLIFF